MENLKDLLTPKAFNKISYVAVIAWFLFGGILLGKFAELENSDSFRCGVKLEKMDVVRGKCSDQYKKQYNKSGIPVYGFVMADFFLFGIVCVTYSQVVKSRVNDLLVAGRSRRADPERQNSDRNRPKRRKLFAAYFCQLATRFAMGIVFTVLQTQVLYPDNFPSNFRCQIAGGSHAANASSTAGNIHNSTMYECHNQKATETMSWMIAVIVGHGVLAVIILIEMICILALRVKKGKRFLEDLGFLKYYLPAQEPQELDRPRQDPAHELSAIIPEPSSVNEFIKSQQECIIESTEKDPGLKTLFQVKHGEGKRNKDLKLDEIYINLSLILDRARYDFAGTRREQLRVFPMPKENFRQISREDIVDAENKKILIVGRPGIGKTLFLTKWIRDWGLGKALNYFEVAFFLKFRKFNSVGELSLRDLLSRSEYARELSDEVWNHVLTNPERVLIFFDGLDEFLDRSSVANERSSCKDGEKPMLLSAMFYNIVEGNLLPGASVLTTTRPTAVSDVTDLPFGKTVEILGFTSQQVEEYVENFAKDAPEDVPDAGKKIWEHIKTNMNIFSLCYIPVNCLIICSCLLQVLKFHSEKGLTGVGLPTKLTDIYRRAVKLFCFRHDEEYRDEPLRQEDINSKHLPPKVEKKIKPLTKLAFDGLTQKRLIFGQSEVPEDLLSSSLFHRLPDRQTDAYTSEAQYCFIHLTMQEFLAAKHVTETMKGEELRRFVEDYISNGEWQLVLQFVAGLLGKQSIEIFTDLLPKTTEEKDENDLLFDSSLHGRTVTCWPTPSEKGLALTLMKCMDEANESGAVVQSKLEEIGFNAVDFSLCGLAPADCTAVAHFLQSCKQLSLINLAANNIGPLGCVEIVKLFDISKSQLTSLDLSYNNITDKGVKVLSEVLVNNNKLRSLNLRGNNITDKGAKFLSEVLVNNNKLRSLNLSVNNITDKGVKFLSEVLVNNNKLRSLNLSYNNITDKGVKLLSEVLVNNNKLHSLILSGNNITDKGVKLLSEVLVNNNKLRILFLAGNTQITNEAIKQIKQALNPNCVVLF